VLRGKLLFVWRDFWFSFFRWLPCSLRANFFGFVPGLSLRRIVLAIIEINAVPPGVGLFARFVCVVWGGVCGCGLLCRVFRLFVLPV